MSHKKHPTIAACGIDCGLCPRYYTAGTSRCPGCGGEGFDEAHPSCGVLTCCAKKHSLEVCAECSEFPCAKYNNAAFSRDSFVTHQRMMPNHEMVMEIGLHPFLLLQAERIAFLETALAQHDNGRNKGFFCIAAALLPVEDLKNALSLAAQGDNLRDTLSRMADAEGVSLALNKRGGK
ncbi:MAG: DUF3795 domain-containing protein [Clostridiales bacterium]|nr:DUF3795 domain-containing protein [Clostridiales bacterium]